MKQYLKTKAAAGFLFACLAAQPSLTAQTAEEAFTAIYNYGIWGVNAEGQGVSGSGSTLEATECYRIFLQQFLKDFQIRSVIDLGCGDWEFSQAINWDGIDYTGYDIVQSVIERDQKRFAKPNIHFVHGNAIRMDMPSADLLICKDVLQHLPNEDIFLLFRQLPKFKYCLITNDVDPATLTSPNPNIAPGQYRPVDLTQPPFYLAGYKALTYVSGPFVKQVLFLYRGY